MFIPGRLSDGGSTQSSSIRSASLSFRRRDHLLCSLAMTTKWSSNKVCTSVSPSESNPVVIVTASSTARPRRSRSSNVVRSAGTKWKTARGYWRETIDDSGDESCGKRLRAADPQFSGRGIGEELKLFHALAQLVEYSDTALVQRAAINRWFNSVRAPVEKAQSHGVLDIGISFGNGRLRHSEISGGKARADVSHQSRFLPAQLHMRELACRRAP